MSRHPSIGALSVLVGTLALGTAGCGASIVAHVEPDELVGLAGASRETRTRRAVVTEDGQTVEIGGPFHVVVVARGGPRRTFRHPVVVERDGDDLVLRGSNRPAARIAASAVRRIVVYAGRAQVPREPAVARDLAQAIDCPLARTDVDPIGDDRYATRGCGRVAIHRCGPSHGDRRLQLEARSDCTELASDGWDEAVSPWRVR